MLNELTPSQAVVINKTKKILLKMSKQDFSPGRNHIVLHRDNINYYHPNVFHNSKIYDYRDADGTLDYFPISIDDILNATRANVIYQNKYRSRIDTAMILNHPLRRVKIMGKVISEQLQEYERRDGETENYTLHFLNLNDGSTEKFITCKLQKYQYSVNNLNFEQNYNKLVEIKGTIQFFRENIEILADVVKVVGLTDNIRVEINWWKQVLQFRKNYISEPWVLKENDLLSTDALIEANLSIQGVEEEEEEEEEREEEKEISTDDQLKYRLEYHEAQRKGKLIRIKFPNKVPSIDLYDSVIVNKERLAKHENKWNDEDHSIIVLSDSDSATEKEQDQEHDQDERELPAGPSIFSSHFKFIEESKNETSLNCTEDVRISVPETQDFLRKQFENSAIKIYNESAYEMELIVFMLKQKELLFPINRFTEDSILLEILTGIALTNFYNETFIEAKNNDNDSLNSKFHNFDIKESKKTIFHSCRKRLAQLNLFKLIRSNTTKSYLIDANTLFEIKEHIEKDLIRAVKGQIIEIEKRVNEAGSYSKLSKSQYAKRLQSILKDSLRYTIELETLNLKFQTWYESNLKHQYLNTIINYLISNDTEKFGKTIIKEGCCFGLHVELNWSYNATKFEWGYLWDVKGTGKKVDQNRNIFTSPRSSSGTNARVGVSNNRRITRDSAKLIRSSLL